MTKRYAEIKKYISKNRMMTLHTFMLVWLIIRVEMINTLLWNLCNFVVTITMMLSADLAAAKEQFQAAILSILSLFGGDGV